MDVMKVGCELSKCGARTRYTTLPSKCDVSSRPSPGCVPSLSGPFSFLVNFRLSTATLGVRLSWE